MAEEQKTELVMHGARRFKRGAYDQATEAGPKRAYTGGANTLREQGYGDWLNERSDTEDGLTGFRGTEIGPRTYAGQAVLRDKTRVKK